MFAFSMTEVTWMIVEVRINNAWITLACMFWSQFHNMTILFILIRLSNES